MGNSFALAATPLYAEASTEPVSPPSDAARTESTSGRLLGSCRMMPWSTSGAGSYEHSRGRGRRGGAESGEHPAPVLADEATSVLALVMPLVLKWIVGGPVAHRDPSSLDHQMLEMCC